MAGIAVEVWTTNAGIFFDNFVVTHSLEDAFKFADTTFSLKAIGKSSLLIKSSILKNEEMVI